MRVSLSNSDRSFSVAPDQSVLDAALSAGLNLPHSCKNGNCGACRARLLRGTVTYPNGIPLGLGSSERAEGYILLCQCRAGSDLRIETYEIKTPDQVSIKRLPARIERMVPLSHDVMGLYLRLPAAEPLSFAPGQYLDIMLSGGRRRSFSIASPPHDARLLELHVRRVAGGEFTERLFAAATRSDLLTIEAPLGQFVYRPGQMPGQTPGPAPGSPGGAAPPMPGAAAPSMPGAVARPMLLVGGGTGLAPLYSIMRHVIERHLERRMILYWGVRSERDLYAHAALEQLSRSGADLRYTPVLSEATPEWSGRRGLVHEAALRDISDLGGFDVYASGPPAMIAAIQAEFGARGVAPSRLFFDSFDYAPDALERQRMSAVTKS